MGNLNYCVVCKDQLAPDDYDGICAECDAVCEECGGEGRLEDWSQMSDADGHHPTFVCWKCNGTGKQPHDGAEGG